MSEEEIIEKIEKIIKHFESQEYILNGQKIYEYIQGLLDLYIKEKEKNKELEKELDLKIKALDIAMSNPDYIGKDKIKEKIKYWNKRLGEDERTDFIVKDKIIINVLEELLEE